MRIKLVEQLGDEDPGGVDHPVDAAQRLARLGHHRVNHRAIGDIADQARCAELAGKGENAGRVAVEQGQCGPFGGEQAGNALPHAARRAGHHNPATFQLSCHSYCSCISS